MEETDLPNDEGAMNVCALENEDDKRDGIYTHLFTILLCFFCR